jgi:putative Holliday junction resolvase
MKILGIDYGDKKIGLALAENILAEPYIVLHYSSLSEVIKKIVKIITDEQIEKVVIGISENQSADKTEIFTNYLKKSVSLPIVFHDETLSTKEAQELSIIARINRKKRKEMEDAYAAAVILQSYLDK